MAFLMPALLFFMLASICLAIPHILKKPKGLGMIVAHGSKIVVLYEGSPSKVDHTFCLIMNEKISCFHSVVLKLFRFSF